jgi:hypothetical protein
MTDRAGAIGGIFAYLAIPIGQGLTPANAGRAGARER